MVYANWPAKYACSRRKATAADGCGEESAFHRKVPRKMPMHRENGNAADANGAGAGGGADQHCQVQTKFGLGLWRFSLDVLHTKVWDAGLTSSSITKWWVMEV